MFNALKYAEELEKAGFSRDQAEASVRLLTEVMNESFATKSDLKAVEFGLKDVEFRLSSKIDSVTQKLEASIREVEYKMTIKLGTMMAIAIGVTATLVRLLPTLR